MAANNIGKKASPEAFWEVKGWLDDRSRRKIELFRRLYPEQSLVVATKPVLDQMGF